MPHISENEVEKAIQRCQLYVGKHYNEGGGNDLKDAINTLIRAAQSAPVDLEREIAKITDKMFSMAFEGLMAIRDFSYEPEAKMAENTIKEIEKYEERQLKLLPTPSKE